MITSDHCKTLEEYIDEADMLTVLNPHGVLILNADDTNIKKFHLSLYIKEKLFFLD